MTDLSHVAEIAGALSDEGRLRILTILFEGGATVSELVERLEMSQPNVSGHLAVLREAGLTSAERMGRQRIYTVERDRIEAIMSGFLAAVPGFHKAPYAGSQGSQRGPTQQPDTANKNLLRSPRGARGRYAFRSSS